MPAMASSGLDEDPNWDEDSTQIESMGFDKNFNDQSDQLFEFDGLKVFIDRQSLLYMDGAEVDYVEGLHGAGFKFNNPNSTGSCGCGSSFSV